MVNTELFREWLENNTNYSAPVIRDMLSRIKRADTILAWQDDEVYIFYLEHHERFKELSPAVRSQLKKSVKLYRECCLRLSLD